MFAGRIPGSLEPAPWAGRLARLRAEGRPLLDLTDHDPTTQDLDAHDADLLAALAAPGGLIHTPDPRGLPVAREAVAAYYAARGLAVDPDDVVLTASTSEAYAHAFRLFGAPGDRFLAPRPGYPLCEPIAAAEGVRLERYPLVLDGGAWRVDRIAFEAALPGARGALVVHPNHPTGSFLARDEAAWLAGACARSDVPLLVDEVFGDFHDEAAPGARSAMTLRASFVDEGAATTLVFSGLSKVCGLPQLKLGWIVLAGPAARREAVRARLEWLADTYLSVSGPVQRALPTLLAAGPRFRAAAAARVAANRVALAATVAAIEGAMLLPADGAWSAVIALPTVRGDEEWALALLEHDVVVHPGYFYEFAEPGRVVVSLLLRPDRFALALAHLAAVAR